MIKFSFLLDETPFNVMELQAFLFLLWQVFLPFLFLVHVFRRVFMLDCPGTCSHLPEVVFCRLEHFLENKTSRQPQQSPVPEGQ